MEKTQTSKEPAGNRPPVIAVMGHIDHGKSTLLDYIRQTNVAEKEAGGITQRLGAYEALHTGKDGLKHRLTLLDTPGHEAFSGIRSRGAAIADIAVLAVSAEEGVKPQTLEALEFIKKAKIPFIVAITKIDRPSADVERAKQSLAEKGVYLEGYGGDVPFMPVSGKTGEGVSDLLELVLLSAALHGAGTTKKGFEAYVIEAHIERTKGASATVIVKEGALPRGMFVAAENGWSACRRLENYLGEAIEEAPAGTPVVVIGWSGIPRVGARLTPAKNKRDAEEKVEALALAAAAGKKPRRTSAAPPEGGGGKVILPLIVKADTIGALEAIEQEISKKKAGNVTPKIIYKGIGAISEGDLKIASGSGSPVIAGFNVGVDSSAKALIERDRYEVRTFDIIYRLLEWLDGILQARAPKVKVEEKKGSAKILKIFSTEKDKQIVGGKVLDGEISTGDEFKILRREALIGSGKVREVQRFKEKVASAATGAEFGAFVSTSIEIMPGDRLEAFAVVEKQIWEGSQPATLPVSNAAG